MKNPGNWKRQPNKPAAALALLLLIAFGAQAQQGLSVKIEGPTVVRTPRANLRFSASPASGGYQYVWQLRSAGNTAGLTTSPNFSRVSANFIGRGVDTLTVEVSRIGAPAIRGRDTLFINKNSCSAIAGNIEGPASVCRGTDLVLSLDSVIADTLVWQSRLQGGTRWRDEAVLPRTAGASYQAGPHSRDEVFRVIAVGKSCRDTSREFAVRAAARPEGDFPPPAFDKVCGGDNTPPLGASLANGSGRWGSTGSGAFLDARDPNTRYVPAPEDFGATVELFWIISGGGCAPDTFANAIEIVKPPVSRFLTELPEICPDSPTDPLNVEVLFGGGYWETGGQGYFTSPDDPAGRYVAAKADAGRTVRLTWTAENRGCEIRHNQYMNVTDAAVAQILPPDPGAEICPDDTFRLSADTAGRDGFYIWAGERVLADGDSPRPLVQLARDSARFILSYSDFASQCVTRDTIFLRLAPGADVGELASFDVCPQEAAALPAPPVDPEAPVRWTPERYLDAPESLRPVFRPGTDDTTIVYVFRGKSAENGCPVTGRVRARVHALKLPGIVDLNDRAPDKFCFGYPNQLRLLNASDCAASHFFSGSAASVREAGPVSPANRLFAGSESVQIDSLAPGGSPYIYSASCRDAETGCAHLEEVEFTVLQVPEPSFLAPEETPYDARNVAFVNTSTGALNYSWDFGDPASDVQNNSQEENPSHLFTRPGRFVVTMVADNGACSKSFARTVTILAEEYYFPEAFTPNGDGLNDVFRPLPAFWAKNDPALAERQIRSARVRSFEIFDLQGRTVFRLAGEAEWQAQPGWHGRDDAGNLLDPGTYLFRIVIEQDPRGEVSHQGRVALIR